MSKEDIEEVQEGKSADKKADIIKTVVMFMMIILLIISFFILVN